MNGIFLWKMTVLSSRKYIFEKNLAFGSPDKAFFGKNQVSGLPTVLFGGKIGFRDSRKGF